jgi:hypothetical protein
MGGKGGGESAPNYQSMYDQSYAQAMAEQTDTGGNIPLEMLGEKPTTEEAEKEVLDPIFKVENTDGTTTELDTSKAIVTEPSPVKGGDKKNDPSKTFPFGQTTDMSDLGDRLVAGLRKKKSQNTVQV